MGYIDIEVIDLVQFISNLSRPVRLLKIDIEGAECEVLHALIDSGLSKNISSIVVETHEIKIPRLRGPIKILKEKINKYGIRNINLNWQ